MKLFLIRHGETQWNQQGLYQGRSDIPLSPEGIEQAEKAGKALALEPLKVIYSSPLKRALQTAQIIAKAHKTTEKISTLPSTLPPIPSPILPPIPLIQEPCLCERDYGKWEGLALAEVKQKFSEDYSRYCKDRINTRPPGGESLADVKQRLKHFAERLVNRHSMKDSESASGKIGGASAMKGNADAVAIVAHNGTLRALKGSIMNDGDKSVEGDTFSPASITIIYMKGKPKVESFNSTAHLHGGR
ncbi:histidine phosphatase family protein [Candidatus Woesearchaeota archaeon]|nr:histidine phosphatase family protein [Candidatus Woesearchaeota archaeon]